MIEAVEGGWIDYKVVIDHCDATRQWKSIYANTTEKSAKQD
jgi:hypothetical protein